MKFRPTSIAAVLGFVLAGGAGQGVSQSDTFRPQPSASRTVPPASSPRLEETVPAKGTVLFQSYGQPPEPEAYRRPTGTPHEAFRASGRSAPPDVTDEDRAALTPISYDLDARLAPATAHLSMRARVGLRNDGSKPLARIALQISSTLHWESASLMSEDPSRKAPAFSETLALAQHLLATDADHTGEANEAVLTLPRPLKPGKSVRVDLFYSGPIDRDGARLERIGADKKQAAAADWDEIAPGSVAVRGFGDVLWYPVAWPQVFLGEGAQLFQAAGRLRLRSEATTVQLRVVVDYHGEAPVSAYFCGRRGTFKVMSDDPDALLASAAGVATTEFSAAPLGFRALDLILVSHPESSIAPLPSAVAASPVPRAAQFSSSSGDAATIRTTPEQNQSASFAGEGLPMLAVETEDDGALPAIAGSAEHVAPLMQEWFGPHPLTALTMIDHAGQPFEDGSLLLAPLSSLASSVSAPALAYSLAHAWIDTGQPWIDEGLADFASLLWIERESGREAAQAQLAGSLQPLGPVEPSFDNAAAAEAAFASVHPPGQALIEASDEVYYRRKAAAVWWMLRGIVGDSSLRLAISTWRTQPVSAAGALMQATGFEKLLEKTSGKDLSWFFHDWILKDAGLPDLSIVDVTPRLLPAGTGHDSGWLVAVTVRNDGAAAAEVPVIIRSGSFSTTHRMRITGFTSATERVLTEAVPTEVVVNDGEVPEIRNSTHTVTININPR